MGVATMRVPTVFTAVDRFSGVVSKMTATTAAFGRIAEAAAMRTSRRFNSAGILCQFQYRCERNILCGLCRAGQKRGADMRSTSLPKLSRKCVL